jgi:hypothetical protein
MRDQADDLVGDVRQPEGRDFVARELEGYQVDRDYGH